MPSPHQYTHIVVHPEVLTDEQHKCREIWGTYVESSFMGDIENDELIGWVYGFANGYVWLNEAGHPTQIFHERDDLIGYLQSLAPSMEWVK